MIKKKVLKKKFTREDARAVGRKIPAVPKDLFEPTLSENAAYIAKTRYSFRNEKGEPIETPRKLFWRVAYYIAAADRIYSQNTHQKTAKEFYKLMASQKFIPNTPTLVNSGKTGQSLSACFVLPIEDDMESILKTMRDMAMIHKMGGGTGFSFSKLRPKDDLIGTSKGKSTGPVAFLQAYNDVTSQIRQGGVRRGANMGILHFTHPDILRFAIHKVDEFSLTNFNISISVTEEFMEKVKKDAKFTDGDLEVNEIIEEIKEAYTIRDLDLKNVRVEEAVSKLYEACRAKHKGEGYYLVNPRTGEITDHLNAKRVFDLVTRLAWQYGDPGMVLIDRINNSRANPTPKLGQIEATNPCAEQPLLPYDACTLGSINLSKFVFDEVKDTERSRSVRDAQQGRSIKDGLDFVQDTQRQIDWEQLKQTIHKAVHFLDNVLDMNEYPVAEIDQMTSKIRRIGLGVMGWADILAKLGIGYNTFEAFTLAEKVMKFIQEEADNASVNLAKVRGVFPAFKNSIYNQKGKIRPRNAARTTIAPTGTISLLADCSSGIEPYFALTFAKNTIEGKRLFNTNLYFLEALKSKGINSDELLLRIEENRGSIQNLGEIPQDLKRVFVVAQDISPADHIRMEAAFQKYTDNGISKTINFPNEATVEDVRQAYWLTYELGCRMTTIYRDGSRIKQVLEVKKDKSYYDQLTGKRIYKEAEPQIPRKKPTPTEALGMRVRKKADVGYVYTSVFRDTDGMPVEVFVTIGKTGGYVAGAAEVTGRLASRALKYGASLEEVATDLVGISCGTPYGIGPDSVLSAFDAVGKSLLEIAKAKQLTLPVVGQNEEPVEAVVKTQTPSANGQTNYSSKLTPANGQNPNGLTKDNANKKSVQMSIPSGIKYQIDANLASGIHQEEIIENKFVVCPDCSSPVIYAEGCRTCSNPTCGWSKCS